VGDLAVLEVGSASEHVLVLLVLLQLDDVGDTGDPGPVWFIGDTPQYSPRMDVFESKVHSLHTKSQ
jgi:hypothetical protein